MEIEDVISLSSSSSPGNGSGNNEIDDCVIHENKVDSQPFEVKVQLNRDSPGTLNDIANGDNQLLLSTDGNKEMVDNPATLEVGTETAAVPENTTDISSVHTENGRRSVRYGSDISNHKEDGFLINSQETDASLLSGVKRPRLTVDEREPSVQVIYKSLTRDSKQKLGELLQQWSQFHARHCSSANDSREALESGEETYFPALQVGLDTPSAVSFWMDNETSNKQNKDSISFDRNSVPLYDRGYSLALASTDGSSNFEGGVMEVGEASRCFNCGSYNHSLKECPKPRDNTAVNNARKQYKSRRIQNSSSRNPTRYYQNSPRGRFDGLKPGALDAETRQVLGLGELDPPPWLNRMREIGYPPGYLDPEDEDQLSGITIFGDEESREETEEGEIFEASFSEPPKKMSVEFPGVNAPIPQNADEKRWSAGPSDLRLSRNHSYSRHHRSSNSFSRGHPHEERWSRDFADDEPPPPGCEADSPFSSYSRRYGGYDSGYASHSASDPHSAPRNSGFGRSWSDRSRRSPLVRDGSPKHRAYGYLPYSSPR